MVDVHVRVVHDLDRVLPARGRARGVLGLLGGDGHLVGRDVREAADAEEVHADELRRVAPGLDLAQGVGDDGALELDGALADVVIGDLDV